MNRKRARASMDDVQRALFCPARGASTIDAAVMTRTVSLAEAVTRVSTIVAADESRSAETRVKLLGQLALFARSMRSHGVDRIEEIDEALAMVFVGDMVKARGGVPGFPSASAQKTRRWALRTFFSQARALGLTNAVLDVGSGAAGETSTPSRPLTDDEIERCRLCADLSLFETRAPAVFALAEAGGAAERWPRSGWATLTSERGW